MAAPGQGMRRKSPHCARPRGLGPHRVHSGRPLNRPCGRGRSPVASRFDARSCGPGGRRVGGHRGADGRPRLAAALLGARPSPGGRIQHLTAPPLGPFLGRLPVSRAPAAMPTPIIPFRISIGIHRGMALVEAHREAPPTPRWASHIARRSVGLRIAVGFPSAFDTVPCVVPRRSASAPWESPSDAR